MWPVPTTGRTGVGGAQNDLRLAVVVGQRASDRPGRLVPIRKAGADSAAVAARPVVRTSPVEWMVTVHPLRSAPPSSYRGRIAGSRRSAAELPADPPTAPGATAGFAAWSLDLDDLHVVICRRHRAAGPAQYLVNSSTRIRPTPRLVPIQRLVTVSAASNNRIASAAAPTGPRCSSESDPDSATSDRVAFVRPAVVARTSTRETQQVTFAPLPRSARRTSAEWFRPRARIRPRAPRARRPAGSGSPPGNTR